ncbi:hypothetical protein PLEOSDRAFT_1100743 [Pleurotus ostreatus PC15]|uniref:Uncharacterized protein n=3 Tax=Pleurotus TaxID=5320 RepID=A0A067NWE1_PLEO1|nr:hypothetical protein PLEOSDRAFT_1100743 [Pleurotus ostreatus PC15]
MARTKYTAKKTTGALGVHADIPPASPPASSRRMNAARQVASLQALEILSSEDHGPDGAICNGCQNGSTMLSCDHCPQWTCYGIYGENDTQGCLTIRSREMLEAAVSFMCPACHRNNDRNRDKKKKTRYVGLYGANGGMEDAVVDVTKTTLHFFPPLDSRDTVLLLLAVRGAEHMIEPATATYALLNSFFGRGQGALHLATIFFDVSTPEGGNLYDNQLAAAVDFIQKNARRVVVYFITHATPDGDLHFSGPRIVQQNKITQSLPGHSNSPRAILNRLFTVELLDALRIVGETTLFLMVCGGYLGHLETTDWVNSAVRRRSFREVVSFGSKRLQPFWVSSFCARFVQRFYLEGAVYPAAMGDILGGDARLGAATDVVVIRHNPMDYSFPERIRYVWAQDIQAPYGTPLPTLCPVCHCFGTLSASNPADKDSLLRISCSQKDSDTGVRCNCELLAPVFPGRVRGSKLFYGEWLSETF